MGVVGIFFRGGTRGFFSNLSRVVPKVVKFDFFHSKPRKQSFLLEIQNPGEAKARPAPLSDAHDQD